VFRFQELLSAIGIDSNNATVSLDRFKSILNHAEVLGMLVILPSTSSSTSTSTNLLLRKFERLILSETFDKAVYFCFESDELLTLYGSIQKTSLGATASAGIADLSLFPETFSLTVSEKEGSMITPVTVFNFQVCNI